MIIYTNNISLKLYSERYVITITYPSFSKNCALDSYLNIKESIDALERQERRDTGSAQVVYQFNRRTEFKFQ